MEFFHGTNQTSLDYDCNGGESDEPDMLFASASIELARLYGEYLFTLSLMRRCEDLPRISIRDWMTGAEVPTGSFIISGDTSHPDFPVDTLVVRIHEDVAIKPLVAA